MAYIIGDKVKANFERIKNDISTTYNNFLPNYKRYHQFRKYVFETTLTDDQKQVLKDRGIPPIEFNILEPYISRLLGEFAKHEPSIEVTPAQGTPVNPPIVELVEGHIRHIMYESNKNSMAYEVYKDLLSGGFSVIKVWTEYAHQKSFDQVIRAGRVFDPTLCGFDPLARHSHKADGRFAFELYPKTLEDFEREYPGVDVNKVAFTRMDVEGYNWSYRGQQDEKILIMGEYFEKKKKKARIVKLANNRVMTTKEYEKFEAWWNAQQFIEQIPKPIGKSRMTELQAICRYEIIESEILSYAETDYTYLPLIFVDGNSITLQQGASSNSYQMTRPYVYQAKGIQDLKNFSGQCLANYLENLVQHKFIVMKEAIPQEEEYLAALNDVQHANTVVVNAYSENNPDKPIPTPIREVQNMPAPAEMMGTFTVTDQVSQTILGSYDASLGINDNQLSGVSIIEGATQSNAAAMPYVVGFLQAWSQLGCTIADLIPKYKRGSNTITVVGIDGIETIREINKPGAPVLDYEENSLKVEVTAGVSFAIAKNKALQQIIGLTKSIPILGEFFSTAGLDVLLDNIEFHGADIAKEQAKQWVKMKEQQAQNQPNPEAIAMQTKMMELQHKAEQAQTNAQLKEVENQIKQMELQFKIQEAQIKAAISVKKANTELEAHTIDSITKIHDQTLKLHEHDHRHKMEKHEGALKELELAHKIKTENHSVKHHA